VKGAEEVRIPGPDFADVDYDSESEILIAMPLRAPWLKGRR
jgi:hypothetical protein